MTPRQDGPLTTPGVPFVVAHRGASAAAPENTLPAFELAIERGTPVLECDVHLSRDGEVVVIHDADLARTTDTRGAVAELRWHDLERVDAGYPERFGERFRGTRLPRLEQLLELARGRSQVMIEIKTDAVGPASGGIEERCVERVSRAGMAADVAFISMSPVALIRVRRLVPGVVTGLVFRRARRRHLVEETLEAGAGMLIHATSTLLAHPDVVTRARAAGLRTGAYVVNDEATLTSLLELGVESLASDWPGEMLSSRHWRALPDRRGRES